MKTHDNQFGYKNKTGCMHALFCLKETIVNLIDNKKPCYVIYFDAEKAFDNFWRTGLFHKILNKFGSGIAIIIKVYYDQSCGIIKNGFNLSEIFKISSGVKQGGVMSGYLYNFNMDDYYIQSQINNLGAKINEINVKQKKLHQASSDYTKIKQQNKV